MITFGVDWSSAIIVEQVKSLFDVKHFLDSYEFTGKRGGVETS